ncbi:MAG: sulfite exporter TauE/SafE family protein [Planctomycetota bacterium]
MTVPPRKRWPIVALGVFVGIASTMFGIGGGLIMVPVLHVWLGIDLKRAVGTSLVAIIGIALTGVVAEVLVSPGSIHWDLAAGIAAGAIVGARLGAWLLAKLPTETLRWIFVAFMTLAMLRLLFGGGASEETADSAAMAPALAIAICVMTGVVTGLTSAFFGIGGGLVVVPVLTFVFADVSFHEARATSLAMMVPTALFGALFHRKLSNLETSALPFLVAPAFLGAITGVLIAAEVPGSGLRRAFGVFLLYAIIQLLRGRKKQEAQVAAK